MKKLASKTTKKSISLHQLDQNLISEEDLSNALLATSQAIAKNQNLQIESSESLLFDYFSWQKNLLLSDHTIFVPSLRVENLPQSKAACDLALSYFLFHNSELNSQLISQNNLSEEEKLTYREFEKIRLIAQMQKEYLGAAKNIIAQFERNLDSCFDQLIPAFLHQVLKSFLTLSEIKEIAVKTEIFAQEVEEKIANELQIDLAQLMKNLAKKSQNQSEFFFELQRILQLLNEAKKQKELQQQNNKDDDDDDENDAENQQQEQKNAEENFESFGSENVDKDDEFLDSLGSETKKEVPFDAPKDVELQQSDEFGEISVGLKKAEEFADKIEFRNAYKVFTTKFDEVIFPQNLVSKNELEMLRDQLDLKMEKLSEISRKMTLKLKRKLISRKNSFLENDSNRGILDRKKMTGIVVDPLLEDIWINQKNHDYHDTCLTILLDNSGSMRGAPIVMSALACEIIAEILEKFFVKTEIIGFTTSDWKGGKAKKLWESVGRPQNPGRLNDLRHIIYKHFNQNFVKAKVNLGLMLKEGILKENIDGEALLFAKARLMQRSERRKILMVISDGTPIDDSTNSVNAKDILTDHLHQVIKKIEKEKKIEIVGIGIGHETDEFYQNSTTIKSLEDLGDAMIEKIIQLL